MKNLDDLKIIIDEIIDLIEEIESDELHNLLEEKFSKIAKEKNQKRKIQELIKEAYMLGASGSPCRCCNGTGRA